MPGVAVSAALLLVLVLSGETYLRMARPFVRTEWPSRFDPEFGIAAFIPGARVRHTNHLDYWAENRANRWGFLDRDPPHPGAHASCRIVFIGDSFVEAAQVSLEKKFYRVLEKEWNRTHKSPKLETIALGYSGTGQVNQLPWAHLLAPLRPDLVVLVFVSNDFANNDAWLEAARNGWHPKHAPRVFFHHGHLMPPDPHWRKWLLPGQTGATRTRWDMERGRIAGLIHRLLLRSSYLYAYLYALWVHRVRDPWAYYGNVPAAVAELRKLPEEQGRFGDWDPPDDLTLDQMFMAENMPPVFSHALQETRKALELWRDEAEKMGARIAILATHTMKVQFFSPPPALAKKRRVKPRLLFHRLQSMAKDLGISVIDRRHMWRG